MNEADIPIDIHTLKLQDWLVSRRICPKNIQSTIKDIRHKITSALQDMPSNDELIKLLSGKKINYYHCKEIVEILKHTEKDTKSVFGSYGSQRMKDWQEIVRLYEKDNVYLAETAQIYVRNVNFEIPSVRKQMSKLEQQSVECLKRVQDLAKPESQFLTEHSNLLTQLGVKGENLSEELTKVLKKLPTLYTQTICNIGKLQEAIQLYLNFSGQKSYLPIIQHIIEFGNTTVYQYINKEAPMSIEEPMVKLNFSESETQKLDISISDNQIDFGKEDNIGTSSTVSAEIIDFDDFTNSTADDEINWGIETAPEADVEGISFDIPLEEYGIVVEGVGVDGGIAKGDQALTLLDSPNYRGRFLDELEELESFLKMRVFELSQLDAGNNIMFSLMDNMSTHDAESLCKFLTTTGEILQEANSEQMRHLFQLKHSPKYADLLVIKLKQMTNAVEKIRTTKEILKRRSVELRQQRLDLNPVLDELMNETKQLQWIIEKEISQRYKNRIVNLIGSVI